LLIASTNQLSTGNAIKVSVHGNIRHFQCMESLGTPYTNHTSMSTRKFEKLSIKAFNIQNELHQAQVTM
jgi:hypothetical protein